MVLGDDVICLDNTLSTMDIPLKHIQYQIELINRRLAAGKRAEDSMYHKLEQEPRR